MSSSKSSKKEIIEVIDWFIDNFPASFAKKAKQIKPLKIGIYQDIIDFCARLNVAPFSHKRIKEALNYYSSSPAYLTSQQEGVARVDIYGNEIDIVTKDQAKYSYSRYQERYDKKNKTPATTTDAKAVEKEVSSNKETLDDDSQQHADIAEQPGKIT